MASQRPRSRRISATWRDFWDFGTAPIGDFFCHNFDAPCWALDLKSPVSIEAHAAGGVDSYIAPVGGIYTYKFAARGKMPPFPEGDPMRFFSSLALCLCLAVPVSADCPPTARSPPAAMVRPEPFSMMSCADNAPGVVTLA